MTPIDLSQQPPRSGHLAAGGIVFLPRTIDKARAVLPGGDSGAYQLRGFSEMMFEQLGIDADWFTALVASTSDEAAIVEAVVAKTDDARIDAWNALITNRAIRDAQHRAEVEERYPVLRSRPDITLMLDVLDLDDAASFPHEHGTD